MAKHGGSVIAGVLLLISAVHAQSVPPALTGKTASVRLRAVVASSVAMSAGQLRADTVSVGASRELATIPLALNWDVDSGVAHNVRVYSYTDAAPGEISIDLGRASQPLRSEAFPILLHSSSSDTVRAKGSFSDTLKVQVRRGEAGQQGFSRVLHLRVQVY